MGAKLFWGGILVILISFLGNSLYYQAQQIEKPIFLDHYIEKSINEQNILTFYYLVNKNDPVEVNYVKANGIDFYPYQEEQNWFSFNEEHAPVSEATFNHHDLRKVMVEFPEEYILKDDFRFNQLEVHYSNGLTDIVNIGEVFLHRIKINRGEFLDFTSSGSSSSGRNRDSIRLKEDITIENIQYPLEKTKEHVAIKISQNSKDEKKDMKNSSGLPEWVRDEIKNDWEELPGYTVNEDLFPISFDRDNQLIILSQLNPKLKDYYHFQVYFHGRTADGIPFKIPYMIQEYPRLSEKDVEEIISAKQGGNQ